MRLPPLRRNQKLSLTHVLVASFAAQLIVAVGVVGGLSFYNSQKAVNKLSTQLENEVVNLVSTKLDSFLNSPRQINQLNVDALEQGILKISDFPTLGKIFWKQMQVFPVGYISFANPLGEFIGTEHLSNGQVVLNEVTHKLGKNKMAIYTTHNRGDRHHLMETKTYDPRLEPWYTDAVKAGKPRWSRIYQWEDKPEIISISHSYPLYNRQQKLLGVLSVDYLLTQVSDFLSSLEASKKGRVFIVEPSGMMVASSATPKPYLIRQGKARRLSALDSHDPLIQATAQHIVSSFGNFPAAVNIPTIANQSLRFDINGDTQRVQVRRWQDHGLDWIIVVVTPESDLMEQINTNSQITIVLCIGALILAIELGVITARWITRPILKISSASVALASKFEEGEITHPNACTMITDRGTAEVQILAESFNQMAKRLQQSFTTLAEVNTDLEYQVAQKTSALLQAQEATEIARRATRLKDEFLANMSHELRTPLNAILGMSESLIEEIFGDINEQQLWALENIEKGGEHLLALINDILELAKIEAGQLELHYTSTAIDQLCQASLNFVRQQAQQKQIQITTHIPADLPDVLLDERRIRQVLINLLNNAVKFTLPGGQITLAVKPPSLLDPHISPFIQIDVTDNGIGIAPENIHKLFQSFSQIDSALNRQYDGTGLGLALVKKIVEMHGGRVGVSSQLNVGSCFTIQLPCHQVQPTPPARLLDLAAH